MTPVILNLGCGLEKFEEIWGSPVWQTPGVDNIEPASTPEELQGEYFRAPHLAALEAGDPSISLRGRIIQEGGYPSGADEYARRVYSTTTASAPPSKILSGLWFSKSRGSARNLA